MTSYSTREAAWITGLSFRQIDWWDRVGVIHPTVAQATGSGSVRRWSLDDLVRLRTARALRDAGFSLRDAGWALSDPAVTATGGDLVLVGSGDDWRVVNAGQLADALRSYDTADVLSVLPLAPVRAAVEDGVERLQGRPEQIGVAS